VSGANALTAVEARRLIGSRQLSPVELLDACIARVESVDGALNAFVATCFERARDEARAAETAVMRGGSLGPLHGLPIGIKDLNDTEGLRTTYGSLLFKDHVPAADEGIVAAIRAAGAIVLGKTNTPEFGAGGNTTNRVYGPTRNPFDRRLTCGGSSGGSAVALAADMVPLAMGSDTGGSLRTPAAFCGVVGYRPTPGRVPSGQRKVGLTNFGVLGPMARTVADAALLLDAMALDDLSDPLSARRDPAGYRLIEDVDLAQLKVAVSDDLGVCPIEGHIARTFRERLGEFAGAFAACDELTCDFSNAHEAFWLLRGSYFVSNLLAHYRSAPELLDTNVKTNVAAGLAMTVEQIAWAETEQTRIYRSLHRAFADVDIVICPAAAVSPFPVDQLYCDTIDGRVLDNYIQWVSITYALTLTGAAVCVLPCGVDQHGLPFALQVIAPRGADRLALGAAAAIERVRNAGPASLRRPVATR
jgi:Asp-tRNA(Asn)/Glu-tRNA(Gln) amidotransferase A subunit family amidase